MATGGVWGGGIEMAAVSHMKRVNVFVYQAGGGGYKRISSFESPGGAGKVVRVLYGGGMHYDAIELSALHLGGEVPLANREGVHTRLVGEHVDRGLHAEGRLRVARSAHGSVAVGGGLHRLRIEVDLGHLVLVRSAREGAAPLATVTLGDHVDRRELAVLVS